MFTGSILICWWFWDAFGLGGPRSRTLQKERLEEQNFAERDNSWVKVWSGG